MSVLAYNRSKIDCKIKNIKYDNMLGFSYKIRLASTYLKFLLVVNGKIKKHTPRKSSLIEESFQKKKGNFSSCWLV